MPDFRARGAVVEIDGVCPLQEEFHYPGSGVFALRNYTDLSEFLCRMRKPSAILKDIYSAAEIIEAHCLQIKV
jgi:hypothetical protein